MTGNSMSLVEPTVRYPSSSVKRSRLVAGGSREILEREDVLYLLAAHTTPMPNLVILISSPLSSQAG